MKKKNLMFGYDLQLFAENDDNADDNNNQDDSDQNGDTGENTDNDSDNDDKKEKTFSQSQVNKMMAREKKQGRNSILNELGINPKDEKAIEKVKNLIKSQKTDEEIASEEKARQNQVLNEAEERATIAEAKVEAMMAGVKPQYVDDAIALVMAKITDDTDFKSILAEFKTKYPIWFDVSEDGKNDNKNKAGQRGTGASMQSKNNKDSEEKSLGARLAAQRRTNNKKSSFWNNH